MTDEVTEADLSNMKLSAFLPSLRRQTELRKLNLSLNKLSDIRQIKSLTNLEELKLSNNQFSCFPEVVCDLQKLQHLDIEGNTINKLPESFGQLRKLRKLCLGWNAFTEFPLQLCQSELWQITEIHISHNKIQVLTQQISVLTQLEMLDVSYNYIVHLPDGICNLQKLKALIVSHNELVRLPDQLTPCLTDLRVLDLRNNPLEDPPAAVCDGGLEDIRQYQLKRVSPSNHENELHRPLCHQAEEDWVGKHVRRGDGHIAVTIKPDSEVVDLSPEVSLNIPYGAVTRQANITAEIVDAPTYRLEDYEYLIGDVLDFGPKGFTFQKPIILSIESDEDLDLIDYTTREVVIRTTQDRVKWENLKTWKEGNTIKAEVQHFSHFAPLCRPVRQSFSVHLADTDTLKIACCDNHISINFASARPSDKTNTLTLQLHTIDDDVLLRACEVTGCLRDTDTISMSTILEVKTTKKLDNMVELTMSLPEGKNLSQEAVMVELQIQLSRLKVLRDADDDIWVDITKQARVESTTDGCISFKQHGLSEQSCRYAVIIAEQWMDVERISNEATRMTRKGSKLAKFILLQYEENLSILYVDCLPKGEESDVIQTRKNDGFSPKAGLAYSKDIDLNEGEEIFLRISGDGIQTSCEHSLQFNSRLENNIQLFLDFDGDCTGDLDQTTTRSSVGRVDFMLIDQNGMERKCCTLGFKILKKMEFGRHTLSEDRARSEYTANVRTVSYRNTAKREEGNLDIAINSLVPMLLKDDWQPLARRLGLTDADLGAILVAHPSDLRAQIYKMFVMWRRQIGKAATVQALIDALKEEKLRNLADSLESLLGDTTTTPQCYTETAGCTDNDNTANTGAKCDMKTEQVKNKRIKPKNDAKVKKCLPYQHIKYTRRLPKRKGVSVSSVNVQLSNIGQSK
ncbi:p53-induced death domain-containing protein 1-like [Ptychodera flava]|uniref:p53-induced death domain-containing protein 1-like n=1 Tax=Ptychodera flava TaxID=63121 RepID=UPI00396A8E21